MSERRWIAVAALLVLAACTSNRPPSPRPSAAVDSGTALVLATAATHRTDGLVPPDTTAAYTARGCARFRSPIVTVTINPDGPLPGCAIVGPAQRLRLVNATNGFHQRGMTVTVRFAGLPARTLLTGHDTTYDRPFGSYLARGQHFVRLTNFHDSSLDFPIWLK
jgi:hypothetical protein